MSFTHQNFFAGMFTGLGVSMSDSQEPNATNPSLVNPSASTSAVSGQSQGHVNTSTASSFNNEVPFFQDVTGLAPSLVMGVDSEEDTMHNVGMAIDSNNINEIDRGHLDQLLEEYILFGNDAGLDGTDDKGKRKVSTPDMEVDPVIKNGRPAINFGYLSETRSASDNGHAMDLEDVIDNSANCMVAAGFAGMPLLPLPTPTTCPPQEEKYTGGSAAMPLLPLPPPTSYPPQQSTYTLPFFQDLTNRFLPTVVDQNLMSDLADEDNETVSNDDMQHVINPYVTPTDGPFTVPRIPLYVYRHTFRGDITVHNILDYALCQAAWPDDQALFGDEGIFGSSHPEQHDCWVIQTTGRGGKKCFVLLSDLTSKYPVALNSVGQQNSVYVHTYPPPHWMKLRKAKLKLPKYTVQSVGNSSSKIKKVLDDTITVSDDMIQRGLGPSSCKWGNDSRGYASVNLPDWSEEVDNGNEIDNDQSSSATNAKGKVRVMHRSQFPLPRTK